MYSLLNNDLISVKIWKNFRNFSKSNSKITSSFHAVHNAFVDSDLVGFPSSFLSFFPSMFRSLCRYSLHLGWLHAISFTSVWRFSHRLLKSRVSVVRFCWCIIFSCGYCTLFAPVSECWTRLISAIPNYRI